MEPSPPATGGDSSVLRLHPRGQSHRRHTKAKVSPRHVKLQSVVACPLPLYAPTTLQGQFRHELFFLHQHLLDAVARCAVDRHCSAVETQLALETQRSSVALEILTSDHQTAVVHEFFRQWQRNQGPGKTCSPTEEELLNQLVDTIFRNMPIILSESDVRNAKSFTRYIDALKSMRQLLLCLLYKSPENPSEVESAENDRVAETLSSPPVFASTVAILDAMGRRSRPPNSGSSGVYSARTHRVPLYLYCEQLERENDSLKRRLRNVRQGSHVDGDDVGLLNEQTLTLLVQFWELPRLERLAFFCQIASQAKREDCDSVLRVFLDKCSLDNLLSMWDALQLTPHLQHAIAARKHGDDAEAAAREADEALAAAAQDVEERHQKAGSDSGSGNSDSAAESRRGGRRFPGHHSSQRQVDLSGLTNGFEDDEDDRLEDKEEAGGEDWNSTGGKRRRRRPRLRDRGRTPERSRGSHHIRHQDKNRGQIEDDEDKGSDCPSLRSRGASNPATPRSILDCVHSSLLELLKADNPDVAPTITDVAWKLVEVIDRTRRHDSIVPRGAQRKLSTFQQHANVPTPVVAGALLKHGATVSAPHSPRQLVEDAFGANLTTEQQYLIKIDQLQALLVTLGGFSLHSMSTEVITSAYKRMPVIRRLYQAVEGKALEAVGVDLPKKSLQSLEVTTSQSEVAMAQALHEVPMWSEDNVMNSVELMLGKLGKMVRSLAPIAAVGSPSTVDGRNEASAEIIRLAEAMEDVTSDIAQENPGSGRRHLSLDPARRMAMLNRLKSLAHSNQIESLTAMISSRCEDISSLSSVIDHQRQLELYNASDLDGRPVFGEDSEGTTVDITVAPVGVADEADEVLKLVKKAKIRRASAAKQAAASVTTNRGDFNDSDEDDQSLLLNPMTAPRYANRLDIPLTIKQATAQRGSKLFNAGILLRVVDQMYRENYEAMVSSLQYGSRRMEFSEFMYDWHIRKYGLKSLAQQHLLKLIQSLRKYERKVFQCHLCLRFLGIVNPLGFHEHKFVLGLLDKWSAGTFSGAAKHRVEYVPRQFKVRISFAVSTIQEALSERFGVYFRTMEVVTARIKAQAMRQDEEFVKEADVLTIAIDEWQSQRKRIEQILEAVYTAGDLNGDGSLEYDEFHGVLIHLSPSLQEKFIQKVFTAAHDYLKPRRISFVRFLDVVLLERILNTSAPYTKTKQQLNDRANVPSIVSAAGSSLPGPTRATTEEEEIYQFNLLQETWEHDKEVVAQALSSVTHQATAAAIQFRVTFLTQILSRRVDSKTAWMCHRQIMREIRRYQNLNEDQVVAVKTKEETFRKAVMAIRNMQRLSLAFKRPPTTTVETTPLADETVAPDSAPALFPHSPQELRKQISYVGVVEGALASAETTSLAEIEALEDQLREKFLERADEAAIDDFKSALQTIRRLSVQAVQPELELEQLRERTPLPFDRVEEEDGDEADEEEEDDAEEIEDGES